MQELPILNSNALKVKRAYSKRFHNIYLFITERCQLRCGHCYMGERLERGEYMDFEKAKKIISYCHRMGAEFLTFVGGEPTLYPRLPELVHFANEKGYKKVMLDSNGLLLNRIQKIPVDDLYYIRISLDGATEESHDRVRGKGNFKKSIEAIQSLMKAGYDVRVTCTIFQFNVHEGELMLSLADKLGVKLLNFHTFSEEGCGTKNQDWSLNPKDWIEFYESIEKIKSAYKVIPRYPPTWVEKENITKYVNDGYQGCLGCSLDRLSIFPDGRAYVCSLMFDEPLHFGIMTDYGLMINREKNEYELFTEAVLQAEEPWLTGCPAEKFLNKNRKVPITDDYISICRLWKSEV